MPAPRWDLSPRQSVERECERRGEDQVVARCVALLRGGETDLEFARAIGGPAADSVLGPHPRRDQRYFLRVWAARALLYAWDDAAAKAVIAAADDEAWRVREMAAKVVARRGLGEALAAVAALQRDPVPRVRAAAARALAVLTVTGA
ncbi:MAG TPA: HEAT repeat domain-containing protein [Streptosporangiaceae bacterium]|nr:HEAT repeat domain-containing protein [Streptosporangiaceae bacterium]